MLYELVSVVRVTNPLAANVEAKELATTIGKLIIQNRGVVRRILPVGNKLLPKIIKKDQEQHFQGYHFLMLFDSSAAVQSEILRTLKRDPRVIRSAIVKMDTTKQLDVASSIERAAGYNSILEKMKREASFLRFYSLLNFILSIVMPSGLNLSFNVYAILIYPINAFLTSKCFFTSNLSSVCRAELKKLAHLEGRSMYLT